jgi:prepilin peptidase CpaA
MGTSMQVAPLFAIAPLLLAVGYFDLRYMRIPNALSIVAFGAFLVFAVLYPPADLVPRLVVGGGVLALGLIGFALRLFGGGDVKFLSVLVLFVPLHALAIFGNVFSASLLLGIALVLTLRRIPALATLGWKSIGGSTKFPMGVSIALAGLSFPWITLALG